MSRTTIKAACYNPHEVNQSIEKILLSHNYKLVDENGENVWKCGVGFLTAMKYIKIEFAENNTIMISGWIRPMFGAEQDLNGFVAALPKKQVLNVIKEIQGVIV